MKTVQTPFVRSLLLLCGVATLSLVLPSLGGRDLAAQQVQLLTLASGAGLLLSAGLAPLRLPALGIALLVKLSYLAAWAANPDAATATIAAEAVLAAALAALGVALARDAWREARWNGGQSLRLEA